MGPVVIRTPKCSARAAIFKEQNDTFHCKVAQTLEEAMRSCEERWEKWSEFQGLRIYRKRK
jgi:hypothetical protein